MKIVDGLSVADALENIALDAGYRCGGSDVLYNIIFSGMFDATFHPDSNYRTEALSLAGDEYSENWGECQNGFEGLCIHGLDPYFCPSGCGEY